MAGLRHSEIECEHKHSVYVTNAPKLMLKRAAKEGMGDLERLREMKRRYLQFVGEQGEAVAEFVAAVAVAT